MTTDKQKAALSFCELYGAPKYTGDPENYIFVSRYLSQHLNKCKILYYLRKIAEIQRETRCLDEIIKDYFKQKKKE